VSNRLRIVQPTCVDDNPPDVDDSVDDCDDEPTAWWNSTMAIYCFALLGLMALFAYFFFSDPYNYVPASPEENGSSTSEGK
jgi:hypothetical protein